MAHGHSVEEINQHVKRYILVFVALLVLTGVTVWVSYLDLPKGKAIAVALLVAGTKGTLVAGVFMHLFADFRRDRPVLFWSLIATGFMFLVALLLPLFTHLDHLGWIL